MPDGSPLPPSPCGAPCPQVAKTHRQVPHGRARFPKLGHGSRQLRQAGFSHLCSLAPCSPGFQLPRSLRCLPSRLPRCACRKGAVLAPRVVVKTFGVVAGKLPSLRHLKGNRPDVWFFWFCSFFFFFSLKS